MQPFVHNPYTAISNEETCLRYILEKILDTTCIVIYMFIMLEYLTTQ